MCCLCASICRHACAIKNSMCAHVHCLYLILCPDWMGHLVLTYCWRESVSWFSALSNMSWGSWGRIIFSVQCFLTGVARVSCTASQVRGGVWKVLCLLHLSALKFYQDSFTQFTVTWRTDKPSSNTMTHWSQMNKWPDEAGAIAGPLGPDLRVNYSAKCCKP